MANQNTKSDLIEKIKAANPIIAVAIEIGAISRSGISGGRYQGPCFTGHTSQSGTCLSIGSELLYCFSCKVRGDVITLVQLKKFGKKSPETFFPAIEYLAKRAGIEIPQRGDRSTDAVVAHYAETQTAYAVLSKTAQFYNENLNPEVKEILKNNYGQTPATIERFRMGYSPLGDGLLKYLTSAGFSQHDCLLSGLFWLGNHGPEPFFQGRIMVPYIRGGDVVYFIGRETLGTPKNKYEQGRKYKKLLTYSEEKKRTYIAQGIRNDTLFNQDVVFHSDEIIITEGIMDCVALAQAGFAAISPVTVRFSKSDQELVLKLLRKDQSVFICNDNEFNQTGDDGAFSMAAHLTRNGINVKIVNLPLLEKHNDARRRLKSLET
jgi:DNA primase